MKEDRGSTQKKPLSERELAREARRLMNGINNCVRKLPEFQQALANIFFDDKGTENGTYVDSKPLLALPENGIPFKKGHNVYTINRGFVFSLGMNGKGDEFVDIEKRNIKTDTITTVNILLERRHLSQEINGKIIFSQSSRESSSKEKRLENSISAIEEVDRFIRDLNSSPAPTQS